MREYNSIDSDKGDLSGDYSPAMDGDYLNISKIHETPPSKKKGNSSIKETSSSQSLSKISTDNSQKSSISSSSSIFDEQDVIQFDEMMEKYLFHNSLDPPTTKYCNVIKILCHHYSKTIGEKFDAKNLTRIIQGYNNDIGNIKWSGTSGVSKFCNKMEPKHFCKYCLFHMRSTIDYNNQF